YLGIARARDDVRPRVDRACARPKAPREACSQAAEVLALGIGEVEVGEHLPYGDRCLRKQWALDPAPPSHKMRQRLAWNAIRQHKVDLLPLRQRTQRGDHGAPR